MGAQELIYKELLNKIIKKIQYPEEYKYFSTFLKKSYVIRELELIFFKNDTSLRSIKLDKVNQNLSEFFIENKMRGMENILFLMYQNFGYNTVDKNKIVAIFKKCINI